MPPFQTRVDLGGATPAGIGGRPPYCDEGLDDGRFDGIGGGASSESSGSGDTVSERDGVGGNGSFCANDRCRSCFRKAVVVPPFHQPRET